VQLELGFELRKVDFLGVALLRLARRLAEGYQAGGVIDRSGGQLEASRCPRDFDASGRVHGPVPCTGSFL
jgi:hypothetical protein